MSLIVNFSSKINNNQQKYKHLVSYQASKVLIEIVKLLFKERFIRGFFVEKQNNKAYVFLMLKYGSHQNTFQKMSAISKLNSEKKFSQIRKYNNGLGLYVLSTSKGLITNYEATNLKLGGNLIIKIF